MNELLELERGFWLEGAAFYREHLAEDVLMQFPGVGLLRRAEIIQGIEGGTRWARVEIRGEQFLELAPDTLLLCYEARAQREGAADYSALASSIYVRRGSAWMLAFHQQSPALT